jgi:uncharacterized Zn finger protein
MDFRWKPYVPVAQRRREAQRAVDKSRKAGKTLSPVALAGRTIASTFWGKAWCENLERYSDFANRLPRGRSYVRNGAVVDLAIGEGEIIARVMGSRLYRTTVKVAPVPNVRWRAIAADCAGSIDSLVELMQGRLSTSVMERICREGSGLFPAPREIAFECTCPDWASMCKHVAAVLYGVGARLDKAPELLFTLRKVDAAALIAGAGDRLPLGAKAPAARKLLDAAKISEVFGIEMAGAAAPKPRAATKAARKSKRKSRRPASKAARKARP